MPTEPGPLIASGRDADVYEFGPHLVLRRSRTGRSSVVEAATMAYLHREGYPVPAVHELLADGRDLVMERVAGVTMVDAIKRHPWTAGRHGATLARLHRELHDVTPPPSLPAAPVGDGDRLLHLDLHPLNVMLGSSGPVVIDWTNACVGDPAVDVDLAWVLMASGDVAAGRVVTALAGVVRSRLLHSFLSHFDREPLRAQLRDVVAWKDGNPNLTAGEKSRMRAVVEQEAQRRR